MIEPLPTDEILEQYPDYKDLFHKPDFLLLRVKKWKFEVVEVNFMNELEKCMAGEWYDCHNAIFLEYKNNARNLLSQYNSFSYNQKKEKTEALKQLFGSMGTNVSVGLPFICE